MISEQKQDSILRPFQILINQLDSELEASRATLIDWEKASSISAAASDTINHDELDVKIQQLEKCKSDVESFVQGLRARMEAETVNLEELENGLRPSLAGFTSMLNTTRALLNFRYTTVQKNEINRRITAINASRMLSNADMMELQELWTSVLSLKNDKRLMSARKTFEDRLNDWEKLIEQKRKTAW
jgi:hypothetical protein